MEHREYQAPLGFVIDSIRIRCVHCDETMAASEASRHKLEHSLAAKKEKGSGRRQCSCPPGGPASMSCPKHSAYIQARRYGRRG